MAKLVYTAITSLDLYVEDEHGGFAWAHPDEEVHAFANDLARPIGTYVLGRRMYETMAWWESVDTGPDQDAVLRDFAEHWQAADKLVLSRTLGAVSTARTRLERELDPEAIRALKRTAAADVAVGGAELAGQALAAGLVDELHLLLSPVVVGGGKRALPDGLATRLELLGERRFASGVVHVSYRVAAAG